jgi:hypothetical protein
VDKDFALTSLQLFQKWILAPSFLKVDKDFAPQRQSLWTFPKSGWITFFV